MAPDVPDGAWCLLRQPVSELNVRKKMLIRVADEDPQAGGAWLLKTVGAIETADGGLRVRLDSRSADYPSIWMNVSDEGDARVIAELVEVLQPYGSR